jgi:nucleotide-binding universal stress UspA family protein
MKILVATDGSECGETAVNKACEIAAGLKDAEIEVVSVYETPAMTIGGPYVGVPVFYPELVEGAKAVAQGAAATARTTVSTECPAVAVNSLVCMGGPAQMILETAKEWGADLIVVGSHGYGFWGRTFHGSVSDNVVRHAECSVLVVR